MGAVFKKSVIGVLFKNSPAGMLLGADKSTPSASPAQAAGKSARNLARAAIGRLPAAGVLSSVSGNKKTLLGV